MNIKQAFEFKEMREQMQELMARVEKLETQVRKPSTRKTRSNKQMELNHGQSTH